MMIVEKIGLQHPREYLAEKHPNFDPGNFEEINAVLRSYTCDVLTTSDSIMQELSRYPLDIRSYYKILMNEALNLRINNAARAKNYLNNVKELLGSSSTQKLLDVQKDSFQNLVKNKFHYFSCAPDGFIAKTWAEDGYFLHPKEGLELEDFFKNKEYEDAMKLLTLNAAQDHFELHSIYTDYAAAAWEKKNDKLKKLQSVRDAKKRPHKGSYLLDYENNLYYICQACAYGMWQSCFKELNGEFDSDEPWVLLYFPGDLKLPSFNNFITFDAPGGHIM